MSMDPMIALTEEIRTLDQGLRQASRLNEACYSRERAEEINLHLERLKALYADLLETLPTSAPGAGELLRVVVQRLPLAHVRYATHLNRIADRLSAGQREHGDLVWLRALAETFLSGPAGERNARLGVMITHAIRGAAQPVLVFRAVVPARRPAPDLRDLALGPR